MTHRERARTREAFPQPPAGEDPSPPAGGHLLDGRDDRHPLASEADALLGELLVVELRFHGPAGEDEHDQRD